MGINIKGYFMHLYETPHDKCCHLTIWEWERIGVRENRPVEEVEKRQTDGETEGKGVCVERIYVWGLSVGYGPGPSVVHSSVMFTAPQAPMCLPVAPLYTHAQTQSRTRTPILYKHDDDAHADSLRYKNPVTVQLPVCYIIGELTSACFISFFLLSRLIYLTLNADFSTQTASEKSLNWTWISKTSCRVSVWAKTGLQQYCYRPQREKNRVRERSEGGANTSNLK